MYELAKKYLTGDVDKFGELVQKSFNKSIDQLPPEILVREKRVICSFLSDFFPSFTKEMEKTVEEYWDECNISVK